jgi:NADPH:quinone reductase-like Zn-dependent oxidoreductase
MKAIVYHQYGPPEVLKLQQVDRPVTGDRKLLIKVLAAEVTKADCELRSFNFPVNWFKWPLRLAMGISKPRRPILGGYFAGEIVEVGKKVTEFTSGDQVFGSAGLRMGAYAEYMCLPDHCTILAKPDNLSFEQAAAVPLGGLNALHFLNKAMIRKGEKVLINGAGGSIGTFGVHIAKARGAEVTAVDSGIKERMLRKIGVDHYINYENEDFAEQGQRYHVILSMVAGTSYARAIRVLEPGGRYLIANPKLSDMFNAAITNWTSDKTVVFEFAAEKKEELQELKTMIEAGHIKPVVDRIYPMDQVVEAHHRVEQEQRLGSVVLSMKSSAAS